VEVGAGDKLLIAGDEIVGGKGAGAVDLTVDIGVVDPFEEDDPAHAGFAKDIAVESGEGADASSVVKNLIA
jgi:hypothetical protein